MDRFLFVKDPVVLGFEGVTMEGASKDTTLIISGPLNSVRTAMSEMLVFL